MTAELIDGKAFAAALRGRIATAVAALRAEHGITPGLAVVLVGEDPASSVYVRSKGKATVEVGMEGFQHRLPAAADVVGQHGVAVVPGVAGSVMRRRGQHPVRTRDLPVRLPFQPGAVTGCAMLRIQRRPALQIGGSPVSPNRRDRQDSECRGDQPPGRQTQERERFRDHARQSAGADAEVNHGEDHSPGLDLPPLEPPI